MNDNFIGFFDVNQYHLTAISPLDGRYHDKVNNLRDIFSEHGFIKFRLLVAIKWLQHLHLYLPELLPLSAQANQNLANIIANFSVNDSMYIKGLEHNINHDVKAIEYFIKEKLSNDVELRDKMQFIHFGCTSEDVNNLAYALMLKAGREECIVPELTKLITQMREMAQRYANVAMLARTHGQPASPTTVGKEIANFVVRLQQQQLQLVQARICGKLNGASGNYNALTHAYDQIDWQNVSASFVHNFGLSWQTHTTQIEPHDYLAEFFAIMTRINNILLDLVRDLWGYIALNYFEQQSLAQEVGSSVMPHKINPINFENAEGNLGIANALLTHMSNKLTISRWQRDLSDSTVLRNLGVAIAHAMVAYQAIAYGLSKITPNVAVLEQDLTNNWAVLAEAIQTVMRMYNIEQPYEQLKALTRGVTVTPQILHQFIALQPLPDEIKFKLLSLTPQSYLGYAAELAHNC